MTNVTWSCVKSHAVIQSTISVWAKRKYCNNSCFWNAWKHFENIDHRECRYLNTMVWIATTAWIAAQQAEAVSPPDLHSFMCISTPVYVTKMTNSNAVQHIALEPPNTWKLFQNIWEKQGYSADDAVLKRFSEPGTRSTKTSWKWCKPLRICHENLSIRIKNLASLMLMSILLILKAYPWVYAGPIAIVWKLACGKSTILDAMCLICLIIPRLKDSDGKLKDVDGSAVTNQLSF